MLAIKNAVIVMKDHIIPDGVILMDNGVILDFGKKTAIPQGAEVMDAQGLFAGPGLVDIHTHADGETYFHEDPEKCSRTLLAHGVTSVLPALYNNFNKDEYLAHIEIIDKAVKAGKCPNIAGYYMEGPYLNPNFGCERETNPWREEIKRGDYMEIVERVKHTARVWCVAPEREGILEFVKDVKSVMPGAVFSVAHSEASPQQIEDLMPYGLRIANHHTNATGTAEYFPECRGVCVDETVNYNSEIYAELICDRMGIHVHPYMQRLIRKIKGRDRLILISDAFVADGSPIPGCEEAFDINFDRSGEIAGSKMTLDIACQNIMIHTGCSVCDAFHYASYNPSRAVQMTDIGEIRKGNKANLILVDGSFTVKKVILKGEIFQ